MENVEQEKLSGVRSTPLSRNTSITLKIAGASLFGALSIVLSFLAPILPRIPQGIAFFDPVSIIWILCFIIFGPSAGILCSIIGFIGLIPFDLSIPVIGPLMKFSATIPLIIVPTLILKLYKTEEGVLKRDKLKKPKNYLITGLISIIVRDIVMVLINIVVYISFFGPNGLEGWLIVIAIINPIQSIWDLLIPYALVFGTKLDKKFELW
jgi:riboflavin transporter FmnP